MSDDNDIKDILVTDRSSDGLTEELYCIISDQWIDDLCVSMLYIAVLCCYNVLL